MTTPSDVEASAWLHSCASAGGAGWNPAPASAAAAASAGLAPGAALGPPVSVQTSSGALPVLQSPSPLPGSCSGETVTVPNQGRPGPPVSALPLAAASRRRTSAVTGWPTAMAASTCCTARASSGCAGRASSCVHGRPAASPSPHPASWQKAALANRQRPLGSHTHTGMGRARSAAASTDDSRQGVACACTRGLSCACCSCAAKGLATAAGLGAAVGPAGTAAPGAAHVLHAHAYRPPGRAVTDTSIHLGGPSASPWLPAPAAALPPLGGTGSCTAPSCCASSCCSRDCQPSTERRSRQSHSTCLRSAPSSDAWLVRSRRAAVADADRITCCASLPPSSFSAAGWNAQRMVVFDV